MLTATASGGTAPYSYSWSTGETSSAISVNKAQTYTVTVTDQAGHSANGQTTVSTATTPDAPTAVNASGTICFGASARLVASAPGGIYQWYDANGEFKFTGAEYNTAAITQNTVFYVETTINGCTSPRTAIAVILVESPSVNQETVCYGSAATFTATGAATYQWYDAAGTLVQNGGATFTTPTLTASTTFYVTGTTNGCTTNKVEARAEVKAATPAPNGGGPYIVCTGSKITLSASGVSGAVYDWYDVETGGTSIISSPDFTTPVLTADRTYYVEATVDGCPSARIPVTITVSQPAEKPITAANGPICYNSSAELSVTNAASGVIYKWYTSATSTQVYRTGAVVTTDALLSNTTFYVRAESGACVSDAEPVTVTVKSMVVAPTVTGPTTTCPGTTVTLTATAPAGTTFNWYDSATGTPSIFTNAVFSPVINASRSYFVSGIASDGCESARTEVVITTIPPPAAPQASGGSTCFGGKAVLIATTGSNHLWYADETGGTPIYSGQVFETPALSATRDYFVSSVGANGCESTTRTRVTATVIAKPTAPTASGPTNPICAETSTTLTASGSTGSYRWWSDQTGGTLLAETATYNTPALTATQTFWVEALTPEGCTSDRSYVTVNVTTPVNPQFLYLSATYCNAGLSDAPTINLPGAFNKPAGLSIDINTGVINLATSTPKKYTITFTPSGSPCNAPSTTEITIISTAPNAAFSYSANKYCQDAVSPRAQINANASAGEFTSSSPGLIISNPNTGQIDLANSTPGTYTITNTINTDCGNATATFNIEILERVFVSAGPDRAVPAGGNIVLNGTVNLTGLGVTWKSSNTADTFSDIYALNPTYRPAAASGTVTLTLTTDTPPNLCGPKSDQVTITIAIKPAAPTANGVTICYGDKATLSATAPGGTYNWYAQQTGGSSLQSGPNFVTDPLTTNATFYVTTTINGIESDRTEVLVTVRQQVLAPTVTGGGSVCPGAVALTITETADLYRWYDAAGNIKSTSSTSSTYNVTVTQNTTFFSEIVIGNCVSPRFRVDIIIKPTATVNSALTGQVCGGAQQNYTITADVATATFSYSRAAVNGISNTAATNVTATQITEPLFNTTATEIPVVYTITPYLDGCAGTPFNYTVTVLPSPAITSSPTKTVCNRASLDYLVQIASDATSHFSWSRAAVAGISNAAISDQESRNIRESLENTTNAPVTVVYTFNYGTATCPGAPFTLTVTVEPPVYVTSDDVKIACAGQPVGYEIVSNTDALGTTFKWSRGAIPGHAATSGTSKTINEVLTNNTTDEVHVYYDIIPSVNGCDGSSFTLHVILKPLLEKPVILSNSPVCADKQIDLNVKAVSGARYLWSSSTGFSSETNVPFVSIPATTTGSISFSVTVILNECSAVSDDAIVEVNQKPVANAGVSQSVCPGATDIPLNGQVNGGLNGGPITGEWAIVSGTGSFQYPVNQKNNVYLPSAADKAAGSVVLSLHSTSTDDCEPAISLVTFTFESSPAANAGADKEACGQLGVPLNGTILTLSQTGRWTTAGDGTFDNPASLTALYTPGPNDIATGSATLTLTADGAGPCHIPSDEVVITFPPPPTAKADAQAVRYVVRGKTITLNPVVNDENVTYRWTPAIGLSDPAAKNPAVTSGAADTITYTLVITNALGCESAPASVLVRVTPQLSAPNTFTPNADGINDLWLVQGVESYPKIVVDIYSRSGQPVYHSVGYTKPWDGTNNGKPLPFGVYYFVLDTNDVEQKITGYVTIIR